ALDKLLNGEANRSAVLMQPVATTAPPTPLVVVSPTAPLTLPVVPPNFNRSISENDFSAYGSFNWRISPSVNLLLGIRYDLFGRPKSRNDQIFFNFFPGPGATPAAQVSTGLLLPLGTTVPPGTLTTTNTD